VSRVIVVVALMLGFGAIKLPLDLGLREQLGQLGFIAAFSGFRALVADLVFIQAHVAWEQTEWGRVLLLFREATTLQPHAILFWDMAAWHMGWNASAAAAHDPDLRPALRLKTQRDYYNLAKDFLERGIRNNPDQPRLYESLARLYKEKYNDHARASELFARAAALPGAPAYDKRFAAYELSYCEGREQEAYNELRRLYDIGEQERLPTLINRLKALEEKLHIPPAQRIPDR
jgi:tetratricopeptide (TPR) repeat protein